MPANINGQLSNPKRRNQELSHLPHQSRFDVNSEDENVQWKFDIEKDFGREYH